LQIRLTDDRTDDCAFGAMMLLALRPKFRKLRFQMIADNHEANTNLVTIPLDPWRSGNLASAATII
jgi:hypothetical protein